MNNVMLAAMLGGWEILLILAVLLVWAVVLGGIVLLVVWLVRRERKKSPVIPPIQPWQPKPKREKPFTARRSWLVLALISSIMIVGFLIHQERQNPADILTQEEFLDALQAHQVIEATVDPDELHFAQVTGRYKKSDQAGTLMEKKFTTKILLTGKSEEALRSLGNRVEVRTPNNLDKRLLAVFPLAIFLLILLSVVAGTVWFIVWLVRRKHDLPSATPSVQPQPLQPNPTPSTCPRCGTALPADSPQGLCPRCVMGVGLATQTEAPGEFGPHGTKVTKPPPAPHEIGKHFPQLEILECLGRGGMGVVYKARQPKLNRIVALKILAPEKEAEPRFAERFLREAQTLARLNHPNIVTVHDFGETDGLCYLLMEFVDGLTLRQMMREGRTKPEEALAIVPKICEALQFAHEQGVVHRDIKPENVLLDKQGRVKIADFGIAKIVEGTPLTPSLSPSDGERVSARTGEGNLTQDQVLGTPHYMAPEQIEKPQTVDHRADIYSLGVVFYEMLTGELPLGKFQPPSKKVQVDVRLDEVVLHTLEKEPDRRYQYASEVKTDVETIASTAAPPQPNADAFAREILARDYTLDIGSCLRRGWALVRSDFWPLVGITALIFALWSLAGSIGGSVVRSSSGANISRSTSALAILVWGPLMGGLYFYLLKKIRGERTSIETAFSGFSKRFLHLFLGGFVAFALTGLGFICLILPGIYLLVAWMFILPLIIDKGLDFWPAMELSRKMVSKHWWKLLSFGIVLALITLGGVLACGIGLFVTAPIALAAQMYAYEDIFGLASLGVNKPYSAAP